MTSIANIPGHPFAQYASHMLAHNEIGKTLHQLQRQFNLNSHLLLFCCWAAKTGHKLGQKKLFNIALEIVPWHNKIVVELSRLNKLMQHEKLSSGNTLIDETITLSSTIEQLIIADSLTYEPQERNITQQLNDACRNLLAYCKNLQISPSSSNNYNFETLLAWAFPELDHETIKPAWSSLNHTKQFTKYTISQQNLDLGDTE